MDEILKEELNQFVERMRKRIAEARREGESFPPGGRVAGYFAGVAQGVEMCMDTLIEIMEDNEDG